jgi:epoxyqueuosine reductase
MPPEALAAALKAEARRLGFAAVGITTVEPFERDRDRALRAIDAGRMDGMAWYTKERVHASADLGARYAWARSIVSLAWPYAPAWVPGRRAAPNDGSIRGRFAAYACLDGDDGPVDYHALLAARCNDLAAWLRLRVEDVRTKHFVDHGWAMDRAIAERAGVGFTGKNTTLITREAGSYVLLAELLTSVDLPADQPSRKGCGTCRACIPACPTGALVSPGVIDSPRCISYLTIEHRGAIPLELRPLIGDWAFGCDLCQEACPINQRLAPPVRAAGPASSAAGPVPFPDLVECLELSDAEFAARFRGTAVARTGRAGLARNCAIALGNSGNRAARPALERAHEHDPDDVVREAAGWALRRLAA